MIAKSSLVLDVKPWDDETDMSQLEKSVRCECDVTRDACLQSLHVLKHCNFLACSSIVCDGLLWGASKLVPVGYGIKKLQITCVVEDEKVSIDWLEEQITGFEDFVQSMDIAAFNKI